MKMKSMQIFLKSEMTPRSRKPSICFDEANNIKHEPYAEFVLVFPREDSDSVDNFPQPMKFKQENGDVLVIQKCSVNVEKLKGAENPGEAKDSFKENSEKELFVLIPRIDDEKAKVQGDQQVCDPKSSKVFSHVDGKTFETDLHQSFIENTSCAQVKNLIVVIEKIDVESDCIKFRKENDKKNWKCSFCENESIRTRTLLMNRFNETHKNCPYGECSSSFIFSDTSGRNISTCSCWKRSENECFKCKKRFGTRNNLMQHIAIHFDEAKDECKLCNTRLVTARLPQHMRLTHGEMKFECDLCGYKANNILRIDVHMNSHMKPYHCKTCDKGFSELRYFEEHKLNHSKPNPFKCKKCDKAYTRLTSLNRHMQTTHSRARNFKCDQCKYAGKTQDDLTTHKKSHSQAYGCDLCDRKFSRTSLLKEHRVLHDNPFAYQCPKCELALSKKKDVKKHLQTGNKYCKYRIKKNLKAKQGKSITAFIEAEGKFMDSTKNKLFECFICNNKYPTKVYLKIHITGVHVEKKKI